VLRDTRQYAEAESAFREAIRLDPALREADNNLSQLLRQQKSRAWRRNLLTIRRPRP
jgi:hypothetical protein